MTRLVSQEMAAVSFSPDGQNFVAVTYHGRLEDNVREFKVLLYDSLITRAYALGTRSQPVEPREVASFLTSSNRVGVRRIRWSRSRRAFTFIAEAGDIPQLYEYDIAAQVLRPLTHLPRGVWEYDISRTRILITTEAPSQGDAYSSVSRNGGVVTTEKLFDFMRPSAWRNPDVWSEYESVLIDNVSGRQLPLDLPHWVSMESDLLVSLSPGGRYAVTLRTPGKRRPHWILPADDQRTTSIGFGADDTVPPFITEFFLIDLASGAITSVLDAPNANLVGSYSKPSAIWLDDENLILTNVLQATPETGKLGADPVIIHYDLKTQTTRRLARLERGQDGRFERLSRFFTGPGNRPCVRAAGQPRVRCFQRHRGKVRILDTTSKTPVNVTVREGHGSPPDLFAEYGEQSKLLMRLNPQFEGIQFNRAEALTWSDSSGREWRGGLVYPTRYSKSQRYPLVIQTHGFDPDRFLIDGAYPTAMAAQALASRGILVLQMPDARIGAQEEAAVHMRGYEGAIEHLDRAGLIDRHKVGLVGFSRTVYHVAWTLTHSDYPFAAAILSDGVDGGYLQYLANADAYAGSTRRTYEGMNAGPGFGPTLSAWLQRAPGFNTERIRTPIRFEERTPLSSWELFASLRLQGKAAELALLPGASHEVEKPLDRLSSQMGAVDWFDFWLNGHEESDPSKREQYARWRKLHELQTSVISRGALAPH